jgi:hypothetical protein
MIEMQGSSVQSAKVDDFSSAVNVDNDSDPNELSF